MTRRPNDPQRRERILDATLEMIATHGIGAVTHRKIAGCADVPLGSLTYYFDGIEALLAEAFTAFTEKMSGEYSDFFHQVENQAQACDAITQLIFASQVTTPHNMTLMYQLYAFISSRPAQKIIMQNWMQRSQQTLEQWFDPATARALDAFIEGMTLHFVTDRQPLTKEQIRETVGRIAGEGA